MPRVELPALHDGRDLGTQLYKLLNMTVRRFNLVGQIGQPLASASSLVPMGDGDYNHVTGATAIDFIDTSFFGDGDPLELYFDSGLTLNHKSAAPPQFTAGLQLVGGINAVMSAGSKIRLRNDTQLGFWVEMWRGSP